MLADSSYPFFSTTPPQIYRQYFTAEECKTLDSSPLESALSEIGLLRVLLLRLLAASRARELPATIAHTGPTTDQCHRFGRLSLADHLTILAAFSGAGLIMASLVRFHNRYFEPRHPLLDLLADMEPDDL